MGEAIFLASGKGGTGKSAVAVNMAATLAQAGKKVILVDMNMGQGNLDLYLGLQNNAVYNVYDVLTGLCRVKQALIRDSRFPCLYLMAAPPHPEDETVKSDRIRQLYQVLKGTFDYVIIDGPSGVGRNLLMAAAGTDRSIIVTTGDYAGLRGAEITEMTLRKKEIFNISYILNRVRTDNTPEDGYPSFEDIGRTLRGRVIGIIQEEDAITVSLNKGIPAVTGDAVITENMKRIVGRITR